MNLLLDLDGTLTDPREGIVGCYRHALSVLRRPVPDDAALERFIGPPLRDSFCELLSTDAHDAEVAAGVAAYRERFTAVGMYENVPYEGIPEALESCRAAGARLFLATSKARVFAAKILEHFGLDVYFDAVYGSELDGALSNKRELIAHALTDSASDPCETLMIGDRMHDIVGALANGVSPIGVLWGFGSRDELTDAGAERLLEAPAELGALC